MTCSPAPSTLPSPESKGSADIRCTRRALPAYWRPLNSHDGNSVVRYAASVARTCAAGATRCVDRASASAGTAMPSVRQPPRRDAMGAW